MKINFYSLIIKKALPLLAFILAISSTGIAQDVIYSHTLVGGTTYCPGDPQYDDWKTFRAALDTNSKKFLSVKIQGSQNPGGVVCNDPTITRRIAEALRSGTAFSITCNGNKWEIGRNCLTGCNVAGDDVELVVGTGTPCSCTSQNSFRVCIGNGNWGGLGTASCNFPPTQTMECIFSNPVGQNAAAAGIVAPVTSCGATNDSLVVSIQNAGIDKIANIPVTCQVTGTLGGSPYNQTFNTTIGVGTDSLTPFSFRQHKFTNLNTANGADLDILLYTSLASDTTRANDTLRVKYKNVGTPSGNATTSNVSICGTGRATLTATVPSGHEAYWYNAANKLISIGTSAQSSIVPGGTNDSFFVASAKVSSQTDLGTSYNGTTTGNGGFPSGNMFNVIPKKHITIEALKVHIGNTGANTVTVYMKNGTFEGFQTNKNAWTLVGSYDVTGAGSGNATTVTIDPVELMPGTYGFYVFGNTGLLWNTSGNNPNLNVEDFDVALQKAIALEEEFAVQLGNSVQWDGEIVYRQVCVSSTKAKAIVTSNPLAVGSEMAKGSLFKGTYDAGTSGQPDIIASPDSICYDIPAPTGFANSGYGSSGSATWNISSHEVRTVNGALVPSSQYSLTVPSGSVDAKLCFFPTSTYTDSTVEVMAKIRRLDNNCDTTLRRVVFIAPRPNPSYTFTSVCQGDVTEFTNASTITTGTISYLWDFGDGTTSTLTDPAITYKVAGSYTVKLTVTSDRGYSETSTQTVVVKDIPNPNFEITNACEGTALQFQDNSSLPPGTPTYAWEFGDGNTGSGANTTHLYTTPAIYPVKLTIDVAGCVNSTTKYATQAPRSTPDFSFVNTKCDNLVIPFTNATTPPTFGNVGYVWRFGDGKEASQVSPQHTYNVFNSFNVTLIATTDLGCADSISKTVTLLESPKPVFSPVGQTCTNGAISFSNTTNMPGGVNNTYEWDFGDGNSSTQATPSNIYVSSGMFKVVLKAFNTNGCTGENESIITINERPVSAFTANNVCLGEETKFTNGSIVNSGTLTYTWDFDDAGATSNATNPTRTYTTPKTYNVSLVSETVDGCTDTLTRAVEVNPIPAVDIAVASNFTQDGTMRFSTSSTGTGYTYIWNFGDGGKSNDQNPVYKFNFPGTWSAKLTIRTDKGCENTTSTAVSVNPLSVTGIDGNLWSVYPNPSTGKFVVKYEGLDVAKITVTDITGKTIMSVSPETVSETSFDISTHKAGIYIITVEDSNGNRSTQKLTLQ